MCTGTLVLGITNFDSDLQKYDCGFEGPMRKILNWICHFYDLSLKEYHSAGEKNEVLTHTTT